LESLGTKKEVKIGCIAEYAVYIYDNSYLSANRRLKVWDVKDYCIHFGNE